MLVKSKAKYIQSLGQKKHRDEEGLFIAEGPKIIAELLVSAPHNIKEIYALSEWINVNSPSIKGIPVVEITEKELERLSQLKTPNEVLAIVSQFETGKEIEVKGKLSLVLDTIQDPGNLGTIIRIADWFGVPQIICSNDSADVYNPKVVQATMGSIGRVKVFYTDLAKWLQKQQGIPIYATTLEGTDITKMNPIKEGLIIVGNESKGIQDHILALSNEKITIPRKGKAESLNAGVAVGIILSRVAL
jgi:TrmH family RNA methyltransferase